MNSTDNENPRTHFIHEQIEEDLQQGKYQQIHTRFPPEPNGYLHIGHAKSICLNFGTAKKYGGLCNLRFDDTNPTKEKQLYIESIKEDIRWLGFDWGNREYYASDYFHKLYDFAISLIKKGLAYIDEQATDLIAQQRGIPTKEGEKSPFRDRPEEESLKLFEEMKGGKYGEGDMVLRAKIDMSSPNMQMRDPVLYRIIDAPHPITGTTWAIYPMYDMAHGQSDYFEKITHSLCTLEFENHRPLYEWLVGHIKQGTYQPRQIEFSRLSLSHTVMSKRKLLQLVENGHVSGWDDPRMPTLSGLRRRGYTPQSIQIFCEKVGVTKFNGLTDISLLEACVREDLNQIALRRMSVITPLKVTLTNFSDNDTLICSATNNPEDESRGKRSLSLTKELFIEQSDFMEEPPKKYFRLRPNGFVRLRYGVVIRCDEVIKDTSGQVTELRCTAFPETLGGKPLEGQKVKGIIHWVSATQSVPLEIRDYDRLFTVPEPDSQEGKFIDYLNPNSLKIMQAWCEPSLQEATDGQHFQFERIGYFVANASQDGGRLYFNKTVGLRDSWAKINP